MCLVKHALVVLAIASCSVSVRSGEIDKLIGTPDRQTKRVVGVICAKGSCPQNPIGPAPTPVCTKGGCPELLMKELSLAPSDAAYFLPAKRGELNTALQRDVIFGVLCDKGSCPQGPIGPIPIPVCGDNGSCPERLINELYPELRTTDPSIYFLRAD